MEDYDKILETSKKIIDDYNIYKNSKNNDEEKFIKSMEDKYSDFKASHNLIFQKCITGNMDISILSFMINQAKKIKNNEINNYDASIKVGEKLVDKFIKPNLKKN